MIRIAISVIVLVGSLHAGSPLAFWEKFRLSGAKPLVETSSVRGDADECEFWIDFNNPKRSVLIGNDKEKPGRIHVWDMNGSEIFKTPPIDRPTGMDVRYNIPLGKRRVDVVLTAVRGNNSLRLYEFENKSRRLIDRTISGDIRTDLDSVYGACLYKRPSGGELFAFVSNKNGRSIRQYHIFDNGLGKFDGRLVRKLGATERFRRVEGMVADDELGYLYAADEREAIYKYYADPSKTHRLILKFATDDGIYKDREGLALYLQPDGKGYLVVSVQGKSAFNIYERSGDNAFVKQVKPKGVYYTDGIAVTSQPIMPKFPKGVMAAHNDTNTNFVLYSWMQFFAD